MSTKALGSGFLSLPISIREKTYTYVFTSHPEEDVTTINYTLSWPHLDKPSNTTFAGVPQIDPCSCPREDIQDEDGERGSHMYARYKCQGPDVHFNSPKQGLWVLQTAHGQFNILRPASAEELETRPSSAILRVSKQIYDEALPFLYRDRDFFFLAGPCPRGRYQAYATLLWLKRLSSQARAAVKTLSLLVQPYEEDCNISDVEESYAELAAYIRAQMPNFKWLCLDVWDQDVYQAACVFLRLFEKQGVGIVVRQYCNDFEVEVFVTRESFMGSFKEGED